MEEVKLPCIWDEKERCPVREILFYPEPKEPELVKEDPKVSASDPTALLEKLGQVAERYMERMVETVSPVNEANVLYRYCSICPKHLKRLKEVREVLRDEDTKT